MASSSKEPNLQSEEYDSSMTVSECYKLHGLAKRVEHAGSDTDRCRKSCACQIPGDSALLGEYTHDVAKPFCKDYTERTRSVKKPSVPKLWKVGDT